MVGNIINGSQASRTHLLYYKQGSSSLGARIAQSDYADPTTLFSESKRAELAESKQNLVEDDKSEEKKAEAERKKKLERDQQESENDSFYEKSFETIENYIDVDVEDAFRDSAIFSDGEDTLTIRSSLIEFEEAINRMSVKPKVAPPVPAKRKSNVNSLKLKCEVKPKPVVMQKPEHLKLKTKVFKSPDFEDYHKLLNQSEIDKSNGKDEIASPGNKETDDVSAGQSQAGWVRKMVGQLQSRAET